VEALLPATLPLIDAAVERAALLQIKDGIFQQKMLHECKDMPVSGKVYLSEQVPGTIETNQE